MWTIFRIILFIIGVVILYFYFAFNLVKLGVLFWSIPLLGLALMGINFFGPTPKPENEEVKQRENQNNLDNSKFTLLINPQNDVRIVENFIDETNQFTSLIFYCGGEKQIVNEISLKDRKLESFNLIENRRKTYDLNGIRQLKRVNGYHYSWEKTQCHQDFIQIRDYFNRYVSVNGSDYIRFRGGDNGSKIYSWKLTDDLISKFNNRGEGKEHFRKYITLSIDDFFLRIPSQNAIRRLGVEKNYIVAFDFERNENSFFYLEKVFDYEMLYS